MNLAPLLAFTSDLAYRAGRLTLGYFQTGLRPDFKADDSPVTAADRAAEEFIRGEIEKNYPGHAIVGEEFGASAGESSGASHRWIIDPIDGTKSFMRGIPLYGVLIGLEIDGEIRVGAAYYPGTDELLCAADGLGAWWNGRRAHVSEQADLKRAYVCYTNVRNMAKYGRGAAWERLNAATYAARGWSDAYGYLAVATGRAEVMLDPIMNVWDCGPFPVIFREAGGFFGSWSGIPSHTHNEALACNAALLPDILALLQPLAD
ncbi:MAG: histidinol phosphate phosphatase [Anaerolineae bacterium CG_4_9_14_3_um_filter_57_17]|nr:histidinol phosphate phosphatase [bacterium]NCT19656.1 histidinol phosphate phosphatase [bacterium]OIO85537.1 MAG: histidinol phosphate phosphatase [Anaerolineae bacterium CG2_30_57_67]PJB65594.1 MAG: histidinol phosphate phosphatase [Anaerolineae bacterium CG_4_9_14_3_um_filter_57_17]